MRGKGPTEPVPEPAEDWITQRTLCRRFGISERTGSLWAKAGKLRRFEHGVPGCGRRKYSKTLVERELQRRWEQAVRAQDQMQGKRREDDSEEMATTKS